ncbi:ABC transporter ATP-binding protein [Lapidilactobacillus luobeiensis]|uniref:ABC transporter ATP-binding protein n=1 Tax=Lapidilactobacillus luobeiensis TaxID=2950371 RepID=UPI0021C28CB5|nr:ABC transporter ATP-binding protein [Lapidilactobacillus luobeiensis]
MELLRVANLSKIYGQDSTKVVALDNVSFTVARGEFVAIVGASGSGKSTLLHLIGGVDRPTEGTVFLDGQNIYSFNDDQLAIFRRRQVGLIYQFYNLIPILNVTENITLPLDLDNRQADPEKLAQLLARLGLTQRQDHLPNELSGGQQQRVSIGRALITEPALLLADEPTGNLDSAASAEILALLRQANRDYQQTIVMITHDLEIAAQADRVIEIEDGHLVGDVK